jgi:sulfur carrier protein
MKIGAGTTLQEFLVSSGYDLCKVAVELNGMISPRKTFNDVVLKNTDSLEIVSFVGGG